MGSCLIETKRVLVIEDDAHDLYVITAMLRKMGVTIKRNTTGAHVLEQARDLQPHLILLDLDLPEAEALDVRRALAADERLQGVPVVALLGQDTQHLPVADLFDGMILKRVSTHDFQKQITALLTTQP